MSNDQKKTALWVLGGATAVAVATWAIKRLQAYRAQRDLVGYEFRERQIQMAAAGMNGRAKKNGHPRATTGPRRVSRNAR